MKIFTTIFVVVFVFLLIGGGIVYFTTGAGGFKRMVTLTGVYAVCRPGGYEAVCFLDADSKSGGLSCIPLSLAGGECKK